jgi:hypothetical protein
LLPNIPDHSVDNFIINMPKSSGLEILTNTTSFSSLISTIGAKIINTGTLQILTDIPRGSDLFNSIYQEIVSKGFIDCSEVSNSYLSKLELASLQDFSNPYMLSFCQPQVR